ncbi:MAG TPA: cytochrome c, partial [Chloroflexota bacterium]|nr:cytochrome c [Chloroflexota bacterium]
MAAASTTRDGRPATGRGFGAGVLIGLVLAGLVGLFLILPLAAVHKDSPGVETWYGNVLVGLVSRLQGGDASTAGGDAQEGKVAYLTSCAECHGAAGDGRGMFGPDTFPPATDLRSQVVRDRSDAQLFAILKNGLGFTAMPGYGGQYKDQDIANVVAYIRT